MSDNIQDFSFTDLLGDAWPGFDHDMSYPIGEEVDFSTFPSDDNAAIDPNLLQMPPFGQDLLLPDFLAPQPAVGGFGFDQSEEMQRMHHSQTIVNEVLDRSFQANASTGLEHDSGLRYAQGISPMCHDNNSLPVAHQCRICLQKFSSYWQLSRHAERNDHKTLACILRTCSESYSWDYDLADHLRLSGHGDSESLFRCEEPGCGQCFGRGYLLSNHAKRQKHPMFRCIIEGCNKTSWNPDHLIGHASHFHSQEHYQLEDGNSLACIECHQVMSCRARLQEHANSTQHSPFQCACGTRFARLDVLHRHIDSYDKAMPKFPCTSCKFHRGKLGFRRRDHLVQHLRGYHKLDQEEINQISPSSRTMRLSSMPVCPHPGCEYHRTASFQFLSDEEQLRTRPFAKQGDLTKHMKEVHDETPFPCTISGCDKVGAKGYVREKDFMKHRAAKHPEFE